MNSHEDYRAKLSALLDGELSEAEREAVLLHLRECTDCRTYFEEIYALHLALGDLEEYDAPADFAEGVMERLHTEGAKKVSDFGKAAHSRAPRRVWGALAACAAVVVLAVSTLPNALRMGKSAPAGEAAAPVAPMMAAPVAPPDEYRIAVGSADGNTEEAAPAASEYGTNAALYAASSDEPVVPTAPGEPMAPTASTAGAGGAANDESKIRVAGDSGIPVSIMTTGPNGETVPAETQTESALPEVTLTGEGAADWLAENGEPLGGGKWRVTLEALNALPDSIALVAVDGLQEPRDNTLIITFGTTENPR